MTHGKVKFFNEMEAASRSPSSDDDGDGYVDDRSADGGGGDGAPRDGVDVLFVEDDDDLRSLCVATLTGAGYDVAAAASAEEALALALPGDGRVRLLAADLVLPGMDGVALSRELSRRFAGMRTVFVSGHEPAAFGLDAAPDVFLAKPFTPAQLLATVAVVIDLPSAGSTPRPRGPWVAALATVALLVGGAVWLAGSGPGSVPGEGDGGAVVAGAGDDAAGDQARSSSGRVGDTQTLDQTGDDNTQGAAAVPAGAGGDLGDPDRRDDEAGGSDPGAVPESSEADDGTAGGAAAPTTAPTTTSTTGPTTDPTAVPDPDPEPTAAGVAYVEPTKREPVLSSCSGHEAADGTTEYTVVFTVTFVGGAYDVLAGEPFVGNDETVEIRDEPLVWKVTTTHVAERGQESFPVVAPSDFGWAHPGSRDRTNTYLPGPLEVTAERCTR